MKRSKNIILCNLHNSGSSALYPIFRELLIHYNYKIVSLADVSPTDDRQLLSYFDDERIELYNVSIKDLHTKLGYTQ